jgi:hypothetical protein
MLHWPGGVCTQQALQASQETYHQPSVVRPIRRDVEYTLHTVQALDERALVDVWPGLEVFRWAAREGER